MRIAVPTNNPGGLEAGRSDHFGHCEVFTIVEFNGEKEIVKVETVDNVAHDAGGCMVPVKVLADAKADAIVVGGIGAKPMQGFSKVGIDVYYADANNISDVQAVVDAFANNMLPLMRGDQACKGGADCHH